MAQLKEIFERVEFSKEQYQRTQAFLLRAIDYERSRSLCSVILSPKYSNTDLLPSLPVDKLKETTEMWLSEWKRTHILFMKAVNTEPNPKILALQVATDPDQKIELL